MLRNPDSLHLSPQNPQQEGRTNSKKLFSDLRLRNTAHAHLLSHAWTHTCTTHSTNNNKIKKILKLFGRACLPKSEVEVRHLSSSTLRIRRVSEHLLV